ncbi:MAG: aspartate aminotransferase family protein [Rhodospirillales bacterium]|nr:aspartate aminotransferase family protein [Rhodospirillales bacterium]
MTTKTTRSAELYERACKVLPGGNSRTSVFRLPHPIYAQSAEGKTIIDVDGVKRTDFLNNYTSLVHGHRHPVVMEAVRKQLDNLTAIGMATESEILLSEILCERVTTFERMRYTNSGSEAVMMAIKAARAFTGRPKIAKCEGCYHGSYDFAEVSMATTPENWGNEPRSMAYSDGTPQGVLDNVVVIPFNKTEDAERILSAHGKELACIVIDPVPNQAGLVRARPDFLNMIRDFCKKNGVLLLFDEVITFRLGLGGAQGEFGFAPDLTAIAKTIGGGFPVGAVGGRADVMSVFDPSKGKPKAPHAGTFNANPVTMTAGAAAMKHLTKDRMDYINRLGERARKQIAEAFKAAGIPGQVTGMGSLFRFHFSTDEFTDYRSTFASAAQKKMVAALSEYLLDHGFLLAPTGMGNISTVVGEADVDRLSETVLAGLREISRKQAAAQ